MGVLFTGTFEHTLGWVCTMSNIGAFPQFSHSGSPSSPTSRRILNSWKEIAAYLGRGVRTVQRYEGRLRFPVHRPGARKRGSVLAFSDEIELWLRSTPLRNEELSSATNGHLQPTANLAFTNPVNNELERAKQETEAAYAAYLSALEKYNALKRDPGKSDSRDGLKRFS